MCPWGCEWWVIYMLGMRWLRLLLIRRGTKDLASPCSLLASGSSWAQLGGMVGSLARAMGAGDNLARA